MRATTASSVPRMVGALAAGDFTDIAASFAAAGFAVQTPDSGILQLTRPNPPQPQVRLLLSVGIHGDETAPIEMLADLLEKFAAAPQALAPDLMVVVGNPGAIESGTRFIDADLNRMFRDDRGELVSATEAGRADAIMQATSVFFSKPDVQKWHFDLHTAIRPSPYPRFAIVPDVIWDDRQQQLLGWLGWAGIQAVIFSAASAGTFSAYTASRFGTASATVELGQIGALGGNELGRFADAHSALEAFLRTGQPPASTERPIIFRVVQELIKHSDTFQLLLDRDTENFTALPPGALIAVDGDIQYRVGAEMEYVVFPNPAVRVGLRAGVMVVCDS